MTRSVHTSVSVVIPARDEGSWVRRTVEAVLERSPGYLLEIIVVDDGSSDGSCDFIREEYRGSGTVKLIEGEGAGVARARNLGASTARGEFLVFLDAHVIPDPGWLDELVALLRDPSVGLAALGVRDIENPQSVGYTCTFVDENLGEGWLAQQSTEPYEVPCIMGCCSGMRRELFHEMGGFDPRHVRWGVEDVEMSLRTWYLGYRCMVSPQAQVAHYFKRNKPRNFSISWEEYDINLLRCVFTYFSARRASAILAGIRSRLNFETSLTRVVDDATFWEYRDELRRRFCRDEEWYFSRFAKEFAPFEHRLEELRDKGGNGMATQRPQVVCPACGAINIGTQTHCLRCQAPLPAAGAAHQPELSQPSTAGPTFCTQCGARLGAGMRFCTNCGHRL